MSTIYRVNNLGSILEMSRGSFNIPSENLYQSLLNILAKVYA